ncbi:MAG: hypothetical protein ACYCWN_13030 [Ferrimicrobium sp.]
MAGVGHVDRFGIDTADVRLHCHTTFVLGPHPGGTYPRDQLAEPLFAVVESSAHFRDDLVTPAVDRTAGFEAHQVIFLSACRYLGAGNRYSR